MAAILSCILGFFLFSYDQCFCFSFTPPPPEEASTNNWNGRPSSMPYASPLSRDFAKSSISVPEDDTERDTLLSRRPVSTDERLKVGKKDNIRHLSVFEDLASLCFSYTLLYSSGSFLAY